MFLTVFWFEHKKRKKNGFLAELKKRHDCKCYGVFQYTIIHVLLPVKLFGKKCTRYNTDYYVLPLTKVTPLTQR